MKSNPSCTSLCAVLFLLLPFLIPTTSIAEAQTDDQRGLGVSQGTVNAWPRKAKRFAMVIGVDEYQDTQIGKLTGATNDAKSLANALIEYGGFPAEQVILFTSDQPSERRPTRGNILRRLSNLRTIVPKDGLLLFSFAGHGIERDRRAYLLPSDAQVNGDLALLEQTAINADVIRDWIHQTGIGQVVMIIDACRNNPSEGRGDATKPLTEAYARGFNFDVKNREISAFVTLYATEIGHVAYEFKEKKQGYFTWALVEGLKGGAANDQGEITLAGLVRYLQDAVPKRVQLDLGGDKIQRPFAIVDGYKADDLVISVAVKTPTATGTTAKTSDPVEPAAIELSFWDTIKNSSNPEDFKDYLQQYPNGRFATLARRRANPTASDRPPSATGPGVNSGASSPDPNAIATKDIGSLRVALKSVVRVNYKNQWGRTVNSIRCSFEFINLEMQRPIVVAMNLITGPQNTFEVIGGYLRSTLVDENGGLWRVPNSDVAGMSVVGVGNQGYAGPYYNPAEIVTVLSKRDDLNSDVTIDQKRGFEDRFIFGSTTEMSPGRSLSVTMSFAQDENQTTSGAPPKVFDMASEIVVGIVSGTKKSYTLYNLTFDRVGLPGRSS